MIDETARANAARRLLEDPIFDEAFSGVKAALMRAFDGPSMTADDLHRVWLANQMLTKVRTALVAMIETGKLINFEYEQQKAKNVRDR